MEITEDVEGTEATQQTTEGTEGTKEEVKNPEAVLAELRRAQEDLKSLRAEHKKLQDAAEKAKANAKADPFREKAINAEIKLALHDLGIKDQGRLIKFLDKEGIDFDEDGGLVGLKENIDKLKADLPELFDPKRRVGGKADIFADNATNKPMNSTELQLARIFGK